MALVFNRWLNPKPHLHMITPEQQLVTLLKNRNESSFAELYDKYAGPLYGIITDIVPDQEAACTILQQTFTEAYITIETYDPSRARLFTWMQNIAHRLSYDAVGTNNPTAAGQFSEKVQKHHDDGKPFLKIVP